MFDRRKVDYYMMEIDDCVRNHELLQTNRRRIRGQLADITIAGTATSEELTQRLLNVESSIEFYKKRLVVLKSEFIQLIESVKVGE